MLAYLSLVLSRPSVHVSSDIGFYPINENKNNNLFPHLISCFTLFPILVTVTDADKFYSDCCCCEFAFYIE